MMNLLKCLLKMPQKHLKNNRNMLPLLMALSWGSVAQAQKILDWNYNGKAILLGSGCNADNAEMIFSGNEVAVVMSAMGLQLDSSGDGVKTLRKNCRIIIPTRIQRGFVVRGLTHGFSYGYSRSAETKGAIRSRVDFYNGSFSTVETQVPNPDLDPWVVPYAYAESDTRWDVSARECDTAYVGNFKINLSANAYRAGSEEHIAMKPDGQDMLVDIVLNMGLCPGR